LIAARASARLPPGAIRNEINGVSSGKPFNTNLTDAEATMSIRPVARISVSQPVTEGAGVKLHRAFGFGATEAFDPFLLFDDFRNDQPERYRAGFPWHPHRGIETITYVLAGTVEHRDSLGNHGILGPGDVQWMTAGSGILHQEMPMSGAEGRMYGFQLWANLPAAQKMTAPRYQDIKAAEIPETVDNAGVRVRVVCGEFGGMRGPVEGVAAAPVYLDVQIPPGVYTVLPAETGHNAFAYVFEGAGTFGTDGAAENRSLVLFGAGDSVAVEAGSEGIRFLLFSGKPLREPVAWHGPIVMNTREELLQAAAELRDGTFIKGL
jgi:redox-sensitive bicupin YhaK (pirin superfamily)